MSEQDIIDGTIQAWEALGYDRFSVGGSSGTMICRLWYRGEYTARIATNGPTVEFAMRNALYEAKEEKTP